MSRLTSSAHHHTRQGALSQIHHPEPDGRMQANQLAEQWRRTLHRLGADQIVLMPQAPLLAVCQRQRGLCSALSAQLAAAWMLEQTPMPHPSALQHYQQRVQHAIDQPQQPSAQLFMLGLLEWSFNHSVNKFDAHPPCNGLEIAQIVARLQGVRTPTAFELIHKQHALAVAISRKQGQARYFLADPNYGYAEFGCVAAFSQALMLQQHTLALMPPFATTSPLFAMRQYRADLPTQALLPATPTRQPLRLADLGHPDSLVQRFNQNHPLEQDAYFCRQQQRLQQQERYIQQKLHTQASGPQQWLQNWLERLPTIEFERLCLASALPEDGFLSDQIMQTLQQAAEYTERQQPQLPTVNDDWLLNHSQQAEEAKQFVAQLEQTTADLLAQQAHPEKWIALFDSAREEADGRSSMAFRNRDNPEEEIRPSLADRRPVEIKQQLDQYSSAMRQSLDEPLPGEEFGSIHGLNRAFFVQTLMSLLHRHEATVQAGGGISKPLALAMTIHDYANMSQIGMGQAEEVVQVVRLIQTVMRAETEGVQLTTLSLSVISRVGSMAFQTIGGLTQLLSVGLDIYELTQVRSEMQKTVLGTQLAFDSLGLSMMGSAIIGSMTGTALGAGVAAAVGPASVLVGGLGIGITALVQQLGGIVQSSLALAAYIGDISDACVARGNITSAGYTFNQEKNSLHPVAAHAVIVKLDLEQMQVELGSPRFYRSRGQGVGPLDSKNAIGWAGNQPRSERISDNSDVRRHARERAIDMLERLGYQRHAPLPSAATEARILILPAIPTFYINYDYELTPGILVRNDHGTDVMRRMENVQDFYYDFYIFPGEKAMVRPEFEYIDTEVEVILRNDVPMTLMMQKLQEQALHNHLHYKIHAKGGLISLKLETGAQLSLLSTESQLTRWALFSDSVGTDSISMQHGGVQIGDVRVNIPDPGQNVLVTLGNGDTYRLDLQAGQKELVEVNAEHKTSLAHLKQHVEDVAAGQKVKLKPILTVDNYTLPAQGEYAEKTLKRAYFDSTDQRMLFVRDEERYRDTTLALRVEQQVYFYNHNHTKLLRVNPENGEIVSRFGISHQYKGTAVSQPLILQKNGPSLMLSDQTNQYSYQLLDNQLLLRYVKADRTLAVDLALVNRPLNGKEIDKLLHTALQAGWDEHTNGDRAQPPSFGFVIIDDQVETELKRRYWLRPQDGVLIRAWIAKTQEYSTRPGLPNDLMLLTIMAQNNGEAVVYFYSAERKTVYRQPGLGTQRTQAQPVGFNAEIKDAIGTQLGVQVETVNGLIYQLNAAGQRSVTAAHGSWLSAHPQWWQRLRRLADTSSMSLLDLKLPSGEPLPAWFKDGKVILASHALSTHTLLLGLDPQGQHAWLFSPESQTLYQQDLPDDASLQQAFGTGLQCGTLEALPAAQERQTFADLVQDGSTLALDLQDGKLPPPIQGINQWLLVPRQPMTITVRQSDWDAVLRMVFDLWRLPAQTESLPPMQIELVLDNPLALAVSREDDDVLLLDRASGRSLRIKQVFGSRGLNAQVSIRQPDGKPLQLQPLLSAIAQPDRELWQMLLDVTDI